MLSSRACTRTRRLGWIIRVVALLLVTPCFASGQSVRMVEASDIIAGAQEVHVLAPDTAVALIDGQVMILPAGQPLLARTDSALTGLVFEPRRQALTLLRGRTLGFLADGEFQPVLELPVAGMRVRPLADHSLLLFGGDDPSFADGIWRVGPSLTIEPLARLSGPVLAVAADPAGTVYAATEDAIVALDEGRARVLATGTQGVDDLCWLEGRGLLMAVSGALIMAPINGERTQPIAVEGHIERINCGGGAALARIRVPGGSTAVWIQR